MHFSYIIKENKLEIGTPLYHVSHTSPWAYWKRSRCEFLKYFMLYGFYFFHQAEAKMLIWFILSSRLNRGSCNSTCHIFLPTKSFFQVWHWELGWKRGNFSWTFLLGERKNKSCLTSKIKRSYQRQWGQIAVQIESHFSFFTNSTR